MIKWFSITYTMPILALHYTGLKSSKSCQKYSILLQNVLLLAEILMSILLFFLSGFIQSKFKDKNTNFALSPNLPVYADDVPDYPVLPSRFALSRPQTDTCRSQTRADDVSQTLPDASTSTRAYEHCALLRARGSAGTLYGSGKRSNRLAYRSSIWIGGSVAGIRRLPYLQRTVAKWSCDIYGGGIHHHAHDGRSGEHAGRGQILRLARHLVAQRRQLRGGAHHRFHYGAHSLTYFSYVHTRYFARRSQKTTQSATSSLHCADILLCLRLSLIPVSLCARHGHWYQFLEFFQRNDTVPTAHVHLGRAV